MYVKCLTKAKIKQYLSKDISKEELYKWSLEILHKILKGDIIDLRYLEMWGIITGIAEINDIDNSYCDEIVRRFDRILSGEEYAAFTFFIQIPEKCVVNNLPQIKRILMKYSVEKRLTKSDIVELNLVANKKINIPGTLNEVLEIQIVELLKLGFDFLTDENSVEFNIKHTIFVSEDMSLEEEFLAKIITLLECYEGKKGFGIHITFDSGNGSISLLT